MYLNYNMMEYWHVFHLHSTYISKQRKISKQCKMLKALVYQCTADTHKGSVAGCSKHPVSQTHITQVLKEQDRITLFPFLKCQPSSPPRIMLTVINRPCKYVNYIAIKNVICGLIHRIGFVCYQILCFTPCGKPPGHLNYLSQTSHSFFKCHCRSSWSGFPDGMQNCNL